MTKPVSEAIIALHQALLEDPESDGMTLVIARHKGRVLQVDCLVSGAVWRAGAEEVIKKTLRPAAYVIREKIASQKDVDGSVRW